MILTFHRFKVKCPENLSILGHCTELKYYTNFFTFYIHCSKTEAVYEDPQLQDNPAYGTASTSQMGGKGEEPYETCFQ